MHILVNRGDLVLKWLCFVCTKVNVLEQSQCWFLYVSCLTELYINGDESDALLL